MFSEAMEMIYRIQSLKLLIETIKNLKEINLLLIVFHKFQKLKVSKNLTLDIYLILHFSYYYLNLKQTILVGLKLSIAIITFFSASFIS